MSTADISANTSEVPSVVAEVVPPVLFYGTSDRNTGFLCNYAALPVKLWWRGKEYDTSEHAYQASRWDYPGASQVCLAYAEKIRLARTPNQAREMSRQNISTRWGGHSPYQRDVDMSIAAGIKPDPYWDVAEPGGNGEPRKLQVMRKIVALKFVSCVGLSRALLATGTAQLFEHTKRDSYWGDGGTPGVGENWLGKILMSVRDALLAKQREGRDLTELPLSKMPYSSMVEHFRAKRKRYEEAVKYVEKKKKVEIEIEDE